MNGHWMAFSLEQGYRSVGRSTTWNDYLQDEIVRARVRKWLAEIKTARQFRKEMQQREDYREWNIQTFGVGDGWGG